MNKIELLAPAGDIEKLKIAIEYGADAVYFGGEIFSLRAAAKNFTLENIKKGVEYAHSKEKKAYLALNIFAHNQDIDRLPEYLEKIKGIPLDALIISDPGVIHMVKEYMPNVPIHLSTQANTTNYKSAEFWHLQGVERIVLARELSLQETNHIHKQVPNLEIELFVHGAMCISYSGRCLLSNYMTERDANQGACSHPCRWNYYLVEEQRPGEYIPVNEDERGTYFFNSKDLCMIEHVPELIQSGAVSLKIEGRMKSIFYTAVIVGAYRKAIDAYYENPTKYQYQEEWLDELKKVSHRNFTTGFYLDKPQSVDQNYDSSSYIREYDFVGLIKSYDDNTGMAIVEQRNKICLGDQVEIIGPYTDFFTQTIQTMFDEEDNPIESAPHAQQVIKIKMEKPVKENFMIRKERIE